MEKRKFGRTDHHNTVAILGGAAFWDSSQAETDATVETVLEHGVNHIDVAPQYGKAEALLGPWVKKMRAHFFLGCKTLERESSAAMKELLNSLKQLQTDYLDLYQCHAVTNLEELDKITAENGALKTLQKAKETGLTRYLGITTHGMQAPAVLIEALNRFDFDSVLFPLNFILFANEEYRNDALQLIDLCQERNVGMMIIKSIARGKWGELEKTNTTWYQPFTGMQEIQNAVNFVLSLPVNGICMAGDTSLIPKILLACENYQKLSESDFNAMTQNTAQYVTEPLF
jgi:aryl-alcohol dehydrogenase-like predicted oxidoreductase